MPKFNRKPVQVEAIKFEDTNDSIYAISDMVNDGAGDVIISVDYTDPDNPVLKFEGKEPVTLNVGDYIVKDLDGELYVWSSSLFELTHEEVIE